MVLIKSAFIFALLAPFALGKNSPCKEPKEKDKIFCDLRNRHVTYFSKEKTNDYVSRAPHSPGTSGFPHVYHNGERFTWSNPACHEQTTLEFPIAHMLDNTQRRYAMYPGEKKRKGMGDDWKDTRCRVIYTENNGEYCGVICHPLGYDKNDPPGFNIGKNFIKCREPGE